MQLWRIADSFSKRCHKIGLQTLFSYEKVAFHINLPGTTPDAEPSGPCQWYYQRNHLPDNAGWPDSFGRMDPDIAGTISRGGSRYLRHRKDESPSANGNHSKSSHDIFYRRQGKNVRSCVRGTEHPYNTRRHLSISGRFLGNLLSACHLPLHGQRPKGGLAGSGQRHRRPDHPGRIERPQPTDTYVYAELNIGFKGPRVIQGFKGADSLKQIAASQFPGIIASQHASSRG